MVSVRESRGSEALFLLMLTIVASDIAQYYTGRAAGRRRLAPAISPKKTIEGAAGGFVFGALTMTLAGGWWLPNVAVLSGRCSAWPSSRSGSPAISSSRCSSGAPA